MVGPMATKKTTNGHDPATVEMVALLREIRDEIKTTNARVDTLATATASAHRDINARLTDINHQIADMGKDIAGLREDLHEVRGGPGSKVRELDLRLTKVEDAVFKRTG
jgi:hypothetical protein